MKCIRSLICLIVVTAFATARAEVAPQLELHHGERIAFVGNSLGERMSLYGNFEALLHSRFPNDELVVRNFCRPADEVGFRQRPNDYSKLDDPLQTFGPETFFCFFGFNESFAGAGGVEKFKSEYDALLTEYAKHYVTNGHAKFVLVSPIAFESTGNLLQSDGKKENEHLKLYTEAIRSVAEKRKLPFVDLFTPTLPLFAEKPKAQFTLNGCHLNEAGDRKVGEALDLALFGKKNPAKVGSKSFEKLRAAVNDKAWVHEQDYRMVNGWYVYGGRRDPYDLETFPEEYKKIRQMMAVRDRYVWDIAQKKTVPPKPDDSSTLTLTVPKTAFGTKKYSEPSELRFLSGKESVKAMTPAPGFSVSLFASEEKFPELAKPVQMAFDNKGRLWVACMPTYPQWKPGDPRPKDRLLIFEDTDGDGQADKCKVFYDQLQCPTGFEFWNGGVLVISQPRLLFLKDTDGDDKADRVEEFMDGWATDDTHHTMGAFEWSHGGLLHGLEGVSMSTTLETPSGAFRNHNTPGAYVVDPRTLKVRHFVTPGYGNPWCYVFDWWGQGIVGDGTTAQQHWDSPLSGEQIGARRGLNTVFDNQGMRPCIGSEFLYSRHFPDDVQGQFLYACVINMNGLPRFTVNNDGSGFSGKRIADLLTSSDRNFRPADPQIGPDGALWFADWHNPLIGHMQYSQRDPNRDHTRGRIFRLTANGRPLLKPVIQFGKSVSTLLDQLKEYEPRTRYRARRELRDRPTVEVVAAIDKWISRLDVNDTNYDHHLTEALYVEQGHHAVQGDLLAKVLRAKTPEARAAATHVVADEIAYLPNALTLLRPQVKDEHPRVRLEAVRALSFFHSPEAVEVALEAAKQPLDYSLEYTLQHTINALESVWKESFKRFEIARNNPEGLDWLTAYVTGRPKLGPAQEKFQSLLTSDIKPEARRKSISVLAAARGKADEGKQIFERICVACHQVKDKGATFGPELTQVAGRLNREDLIESIFYPNAKIDPRWLTTNITTKDGQELTGVVASEDDLSLVLKLGADQVQTIKKSNIQKRQQLNTSSMPEGLAASMSAQDFVDLVEYLNGLK
ncbi:MAG: putative rane-bound dehydrogenase [Verrucomicrobiales bacterium]|nr:putative rane-bound dehydrogenase [Verrucomicrobiales bacterium]